MSKHKQELVQRVEMSLLNRRDPDFVPNIYFNYISVPSKPKLNVSTPPVSASIFPINLTFVIKLIIELKIVQATPTQFINSLKSFTEGE